MMSCRAAKFVEKTFLWQGTVRNATPRNQRMITEILYNSPYVYKAAAGSLPHAVLESFVFEDHQGNKAKKIATNSAEKNPIVCSCDSLVGLSWHLKTKLGSPVRSMSRPSENNGKDLRHGSNVDTCNIEPFCLTSSNQRMNDQSRVWSETYRRRVILPLDEIGRTAYENSASVEKGDRVHGERKLDNGNVMGVNHPTQNNQLDMSMDQKAFKARIRFYSDTGSEDRDNNAAVENIYSHLSYTLGDFFKEWPDFKLHNTNIVFENSLFGLSTRGLRIYQFQVILYRQLCKILLTDPCLRVLKITREPGNRQIRIRWQVTGSPRYLRLLRRSKELRFYDFFSVVRVGPGEDIDFHLLMTVTPSQDRKARTRLSRFFGLFGLAESLVHPGGKEEKPIPVIPSNSHMT